MTRTFFLDQHGCAKNQVDGELLIARLTAAGWAQVDDAADAALIIVNSCGFIESAKQESLDAVLGARRAYPGAKILLAGCLAQRYADVLKAELPEADGIFGNGDLSQVERTVGDLFAGGRPVVTPRQAGVCCGDRDTLLSYAGSAYVKITEGCDNHCTFCAIPLIRGALRSRPVVQIVDEIRRLLSRGVFEINLIGQDLAAYGRGSGDDVCAGSEDSAWKEQGHSALYGLLTAISALEGRFWVRLLYMHPDHFCPDILDVLEHDGRLLAYFDIPFQSGANPVIKAMNRRGTFDGYVSLVQGIRGRLPQMVLRTTFLAGFPGESEDDHRESVRFLQAIRPDWSGCFTYSLEEDTPAAKLKGRVTKKVASRRKQELEAAQAAVSTERLVARVGQEYDVLIEEVVENGQGTDDGFAIGRAWFQAPEVDGNFVVRYDLDDAAAVCAVKPGAVVRARAVACSGVDLDGVLVQG